MYDLPRDARNSKLLALNQCFPGIAKWIEDAPIPIDAKPVKVHSHQVRQKREDKTIPVVDRSIFWPQSVLVGSALGPKKQHSWSVIVLQIEVGDFVLSEIKKSGASSRWTIYHWIGDGKPIE